MRSASAASTAATATCRRSAPGRRRSRRFTLNAPNLVRNLLRTRFASFTVASQNGWHAQDMRPKHAGVFHVPCRSIAEEHIFRGDSDYLAAIQILGDLVREGF